VAKRIRKLSLVLLRGKPEENNEGDNEKGPSLKLRNSVPGRKTLLEQAGDGKRRDGAGEG